MQFDFFDSAANEIFNTDTYTDFRRLLSESNCGKCPLSKARTNIVIDRGNPDKKILVIGEGPGENEDEQGKAFVGRAGKLLDKIMMSVGLDTNSDMLIANIVKCRAPMNRVPRADEVAACMPYLRHQIKLLKPRAVVLLGATSLKHIDATKKNFAMGDEAGKFFQLSEYPGIQFMVLYHPAALLYDATLKKDMWKHVRLLREWLVGENVIEEQPLPAPASAAKPF